MVFQQKLLEKAYFIFKLTQSGNGPAGQFWQTKSAISLHCTKPYRIGRLLTHKKGDFRSVLIKQPTFRNATHHWFPREMTSEKRAQKFHTNDASLPISGQCFWLVEENFQAIRSTTPWYCRVIKMEFLYSFVRHHFVGNPWWRPEMSAVFSP